MKERGSNQTTQKHGESGFTTPRKPFEMASVEGDFLLEAHSISQKILKIAPCHSSSLSLAACIAQVLKRQLATTPGSPAHSTAHTLQEAFCLPQQTLLCIYSKIQSGFKRNSSHLRMLEQLPSLAPTSQSVGKSYSFPHPSHFPN